MVSTILEVLFNSLRITGFSEYKKYRRECGLQLMKKANQSLWKLNLMSLATNK
ncbi:Uncharacterised protein [Enterobacter cloacae]|nr:Uncharacterised protein [Enterobacter cloacae]